LKCEQATISKNKAYKGIQQRNHTRKAVEEYRTARSEERKKKEYTNKRRRYSLNVGLRNWNVSGVTTKANSSIESSTKVEKTFNPEQYYAEIKKEHS
jgi:hypothetical protein